MFSRVQEHHKFHIATRTQQNKRANVIVVVLLELIHLAHQSRQIINLYIWLDISLSIAGEIGEENSIDVEDLIFIEAEIAEIGYEHVFEIGAILFSGETIMENSHILMEPQFE